MTVITHPYSRCLDVLYINNLSILELILRMQCVSYIYICLCSLKIYNIYILKEYTIVAGKIAVSGVFCLPLKLYTLLTIILPCIIGVAECEMRKLKFLYTPSKKFDIFKTSYNKDSIYVSQRHF